MKTLKETLGISYWVVVSTILLIIVAIALAATQPAFLFIERKAVENSIQYTESKREELRTYHDAYLQNESLIARYEASDDEGYQDTIATLEAQNNASLIEMHRIADELGDDTPDYMVQFLLTHPYPIQYKKRGN